MANFNYTAVNKLGQKESGTIQAPNLNAAGHLLKEQGLLPTEMSEKSTKSIADFLRSISTVSFNERINFIENLGIMLKSGISISRALQIQVKQTKNLRFKAIIINVYNQVESGKSLSEALGKYPAVFSDIVISMIRVGEISGNLDKSLEYLSIQLHREADLKSKVKGAMIYPSVIVAAMVIIGVLMAIFVLPKLTSIFKEFDTALPPTTRLVIWIADFMSGNAVAVILGMIIAVAGAIAILKTPAGKRAAHVFFLHFFVINTIIKKINLARFARVLSSLLKSGIPVVQGLEVTGQSIENIPYRELILNASTDVKVGKSLTDSLGKNTGLFPILVVQMLQVGEESGTTQEILEQLALHYEEEVDTTLRNLSSVIEPLLLLFIGGVVGLLAMALITPIYNISQTIQ
ncbi:MAG: hypothetical protein COT92_02940 [Candidatus Doudnabacteria bacterium CG10_big_fil_rev_8_21_14_0_10_42_18]|uniref:Type II secretion system protein GspF domain-containing protein n=1 Tax=Candidatus Doudnabacteria bacterium CG10_big_fil_rev_8_21_14_0_10_42_18 TaxID=1974552 RepID=A0A2H0VAJ5_9BACT|nr:MAG: hypothetical protein COT92_02940 [Candidatus Doudnabacteria bacterium CG10_big_fil_rev_8_21_14_0_10_42_18]